MQFVIAAILVAAVAAYKVPSGSSGSSSSASSGASMNGGGYGTKAAPVAILSSTNEANEDGSFKYR